MITGCHWVSSQLSVPWRKVLLLVCISKWVYINWGECIGQQWTPNRQHIANIGIVTLYIIYINNYWSYRSVSVKGRVHQIPPEVLLSPSSPSPWQLSPGNRAETCNERNREDIHFMMITSTWAFWHVIIIMKRKV